MDPDPLCGLSDCSSASVRSSWSSSGAENSEEEWRNQVDELQWYISSSTSPKTIKRINGCDVARDSIGWHEVGFIFSILHVFRFLLVIDYIT